MVCLGYLADHWQTSYKQRESDMSKANSTTPADIENERATAEARADLLRRIEAQGVKPFTAPEDFAGDPELTADFDVDEFVRAVREWRDTSSTRSVE